MLPDPCCIAITGSTASGKSALAMHLAERLGGEIVSCDSVQVYRGFDIGSAKPSRYDLDRFSHHLIDVADWHEVFNAQRYAQMATGVVQDVIARGRFPIVCGGSGLYLRALRYGLVPTPPVDAHLRAELNAMETAAPGTMWRRLMALDPQGYQRVNQLNIVHVLRAVEISLQTGEPASEVRDRHGFRQAQLPMLVMTVRCENLHDRIKQRSAAMVDAGLVNEVVNLLEQGVSVDCRPMGAVGYREVVEVVQEKAPLDGLAERIARSTWSYARRQQTWLRREQDLHFIDSASLEQACQQVTGLLRKMSG